MWTFHTRRRSEPTERSRIEEARSRLRHLEQREAELVRRLVILRERNAFFPNEVTERQVDELAAKLDALRADVDAVRAELPPRAE
jgi:hypothetical protein